MFIAFTIIMLLMLTSVFLTLTATALSSKYPLAYFGGQGAGVRTVVENGTAYAVIGWIASTSVMFITCCAPLLGLLLYKKGINSAVAALLAVMICAVSIEVGLAFPVSIEPLTWMVILSIYALIAAGALCAPVLRLR